MSRQSLCARSFLACSILITSTSALGSIEVFMERSGDLAGNTNGQQGSVIIDTGKWSTGDTSAIKQLAYIIDAVDLRNASTLLELVDAAEANGLSEISTLFLDMFGAIGDENLELIQKMDQRLVELIDEQVAIAAHVPGQEGGVAAPPVNDLCADAITVAIPSSTAGTLVESTNDSAPSCSVCQSTGGVWYKVVGTGNRITASLCNAGTTFDSKLSVYKGSCGSLVCEDGNDDLGTTGAFPYACALSGSRSGVTWCSTLGTEYYILVHSFSTLAGFTLDVSEDITPCTVPANDACASAISVTEGMLPYIDSGVVYRQAHDDIDVTCNSGSCPVSRRGVWYTWTPTTTTPLIVSTSTTGTFKAVFTSCGGVQLLCNTSQTVGISGFTPGTTYWILIGHTSDFSEPTAAMNVSFLQPPPNDNCVDAITVSVPSQTQGTTINSFADAAGTCGGVANANPGVWYRVIGTGNTMTADTCAAGGTPPAPILADTRVSVYTCGCTCKTCVAANDTASPSCTGFTGRARVSWCSEVGKEYLILVHQGTTTAGNFRLDVSDNGTACVGGVACTAPANDECAGGTPVVDGANPFTNAGACVGTDPKCDTNLSADVWYDYVATCTGDLTVDTCGGVANNGPDTVLQVYNGCACPPAATPVFGCADDSASCGTSGFSSRVTVPVTSGSCYKIRVANWSSAGTTFSLVSGTLSISCAPLGFCGDNTIGPGEQCDGTALGPCVHGCSGSCQCLAPANDDCGSATTALDGANLFDRAFATTDGAAHAGPPCDFPFGDDQLHNDVWFDYTATCTGRLFVDTCDGVGLDTRIAVYSGCACPASGDPLACNDDSGASDEMSDPDMDPDLCNQLGGSPFESATRNQVVLGSCYKIRVGSFSSTSPSAGVDELYIECESKGACCDLAGACTPGQIPAECSGSFFIGANCDTESCCIAGVCSELAPVCCEAIGGTPGGPGSSCGFCGNGVVDCGEECDGGPCCTGSCTYAAPGTECRPVSDVCDAAEFCSGTSADCPANGYSSGNLCRTVMGDCDAPESCDGSGPACPPDGYLSGNMCRPPAGPCDLAEFCDGSEADCPPDATITTCQDDDGCCPNGCDSGNDNDCGPPVIPTVSEWGLMVLVLIGLIAGTFLFRKRPELA